MSPSIHIPTVANFRPIGAAEPRGALRNLYRSDHLGALDDGDAREIAALGITRVLDFRGLQERASAACRLSGVTVHSLPIEPTIVQKLAELVAAGHRLSGADVTALMQETYRGFVRHNSGRFAEFFAHLLASGEPTVFHCTAGKDRTGFAAALLLKAVGASDDDVMHDYLLTNERLVPPQESRMGLPPEAVQVLWRVQPDFLRAAFEEVDQRHGSLEAYLRGVLALGPRERERLQALYRAG